MADSAGLLPPDSAVTVAFATLGCKTNQFETTAMREELARAGYRVVPFAVGADLVIVNTCTVTAATDAQSRNLVRRARRLNPDCRIVATGCYAQVDPQALASLPEIDMVVGNREKRHLREILAAPGSPRVQVAPFVAGRPAEIPLIDAPAGRSRAFVQIQNGCNACCSYCIIPAARGPSRSAPLEQIVAQVGRLAADDVAEIVLTGIHVGAYGLDLQPPTGLLALLKELECCCALSRLRLGSLEPTEIGVELIAYLADSPMICPHLHIPLQSGSDSVLRRMNRTYTCADFAGLVRRVHNALPEAAIGLDVIVGFPGESEAEFAETVAFIEALPVSHLHVFPYSRRPGTVAAGLPGQLSGTLKTARAETLRRLGAVKLAAFAASFVGRELEVVVERGGHGGGGKGLTRNYLEVRFAAPAALIGRCAVVRVVGEEDGVLRGELVS